MPIPSPNKDETKQEYVTRCMSALKKENDKSHEQKLAICFSKYRENKEEQVITVDRFAAITEEIELEPGDIIEVVHEEKPTTYSVTLHMSDGSDVPNAATAPHEEIAVRKAMRQMRTGEDVVGFTIYDDDSGMTVYKESVPNTTELSLAGNTTVISYRNTPVVTFNDTTIILDPNGWWTKTTKRRMNQASEQHDLAYWVYQKQGKWYVDYRGRTIAFNGSALILDR